MIAACTEDYNMKSLQSHLVNARALTAKSYVFLVSLYNLVLFESIYMNIFQYNFTSISDFPW